MGLKAAYEGELSAVDESTLERLRIVTIQQLEAATRSFRHPWHLGMVSTVEAGDPRVRVVVLRGVDQPLSLRFHTDIRSPKVRQIAQHPSVEWIFYDPDTRIQLRASAKARVSSEGKDWAEAWTKTSLPSRSCYMAPQAPSSPSQSAIHNLPADLLHRDPTQEESEAGRTNFAIVQCAVDSLELLFLKHTGHLRCKFNRTGESWSQDWLAP